MRFYKTFLFYHGGNPYITFTADAFEKMIHKYNLDMINENTIQVYDANINKRTYSGKKENIRQFAQMFQRWAAGAVLSWADVAAWGAFFEHVGRKYGLLTEFKEEGII